MELNEIRKTLEETFSKELADGKKRNIVFWYDEEGEFQSEIDEFNLLSAKILKLDEGNSFYIKYVIEKVDRESNYLIYAPFSKPNPRENWLLDILKYSMEFSTDKATVIMRDLNVYDETLKHVFRKYLKFFNNKDRYKLFKSYNIENYTEEMVHVAVLSTLCRLQYPDFEGVIRALLMEGIEEDNKYLEAIEKFGDINVFWNLVEKYYGYNLNEKTLQSLSIFFMITNLSYSLEEKVPDTWKGYISSKKADCIVFLSNFMNNSLYSKAYDDIADRIEEKIKLKEYVKEWDWDKYINCDTFRYFDEVIIKKLNEQLLLDIGEFDKYKEIVLNRRTKHWYDNFKHEYTCIYWAAILIESWKNISLSIRDFSSYEFFNKYTEEYYILDTAYRKFYNAFDSLVNKEKLMELKEKVENTYVNGYLNTLSVRWSAVLENLRGSWAISGINLQKDFYKTYIKPHIDRGERVFVIVSDALRYEAAKEFSEILNAERKGSTEIYVMQGSIPSYTKLGMASLLPNKTITINDKYDILVDGISSEGTENRNKVLKNYCENSIAIQYDKLVDMKRDDFRRTFTGKDLIYIYHNNIDARGDHALTEREVFYAVEETFEELKSLINSLVNNLTATYIYVVADHGFIYKRGNIAESDKISKETSENSYENRRFILTDKEEHIEGTLTFNMDYILGKETNLKYITPRGVNRFKLQGAGANYVHGGTSLQEIVIPVVKFKNERSKASKKDVKKVDVKLTSISRKITNSITYLEFFQTEKIEDKRIPMRLKLYFADEEGNRISNENIVIADSKSEKPEDRTFREKFVLKNMKYDKSKKYYLILEDEEETVEKVYDKIPFIIDLVISNDDFGF